MHAPLCTESCRCQDASHASASVSLAARGACTCGVVPEPQHGTCTWTHLHAHLHAPDCGRTQASTCISTKCTAWQCMARHGAVRCIAPLHDHHHHILLKHACCTLHMGRHGHGLGCINHALHWGGGVVAGSCMCCLGLTHATVWLRQPPACMTVLQSAAARLTSRPAVVLSAVATRR
jgi:hypothetical protein